jgi:signal peptidase I
MLKQGMNSTFMSSGQMSSKPNLKQFFFPAITKRYLFRILVVALLAFAFFHFICTPFRIKGHSMEPTYMNGGFNFCFRLQYVFSKPDRQDVVAIRLAGESVILLKRVVALEGDVVEFRSGKLLVNEEIVGEPYVRFPSNWNLPPREVDKGHVYVVGDNRSVPIEVHRFGQTPVERIIGAPLW